MKFNGSYVISAPRSVVWATLMKDGRLSPILAPEFQLNNADDNQYEGAVHIAVGPLRGVYHGHLTISQMAEPESFLVAFSGGGEPGKLAGNGRVRLESRDQTTILHFAGEVESDGRLSALPPRMVQANINAVVRRAIENVQGVLEPGNQRPETTSPANPVSGQTWLRAALLAGLLAFGGFLVARAIGKKWRANPDA